MMTNKRFRGRSAPADGAQNANRLPHYPGPCHSRESRNLLKALPALALLYVLFPRDAVLDFRAFGLLDDFVVAGLLVSVFTSKGWRRVLDASNKREGAIPADFHVLDPDAAQPDDPAAPPSADLRGEKG